MMDERRLVDSDYDENEIDWNNDDDCVTVLLEQLLVTWSLLQKNITAQCHGAYKEHKDLKHYSNPCHNFNDDDNNRNCNATVRCNNSNRSTYHITFLATKYNVNIGKTFHQQQLINISLIKYVKLCERCCLIQKNIMQLQKQVQMYNRICL